MTNVSTYRKNYRALFSTGLPQLWCPMLTHYDATGVLDKGRMSAHMRHLSKWVKGFLIPGSTGDGWEMNDAEIRDLLDAALTDAVKLKVRVLIGVLKTDVKHMKSAIESNMVWLKHRANTFDTLEALSKTGACGFTICPPKGKDRTQNEIQSALETILKLDVPTALYQLPQITNNEMSPEVVSHLAAKYGNFILFKDTSGADRVAKAGRDLADVFLVRGAEGDYSRWMKASGGPYDGFLLSTANCFAQQQSEIIARLNEGRRNEADRISNQVSAVVKELFQIVSEVKGGNAFANSNKAADHFFAHGPGAEKVTPPRLHAGTHLPGDVVRAAGEALRRHDLMPTKGYLE